MNPLDGENRQLVTNAMVEFEKYTVEFQTLQETYQSFLDECIEYAFNSWRKTNIAHHGTNWTWKH